MIKVYETKYVPETCSTCLYGRGVGCSHADRQKDWMQYGLLGHGCPSFWLDQERFPAAERRWSDG